jgi:tetratricopeptide (TPR) repeat protein
MTWNEKIKPDWTHWDLTGWLSAPATDRALARFKDDQDAFDIQFLEDLLVRLPDHSEILLQLGHLYTRVGRYREGLAIDRRLVVLRPRDPIAYYNLGCSYALIKQHLRSLTALRRAIELGYRDFEYMQSDPDLEELRKDPRWNDLLQVVKL